MENNILVENFIEMMVAERAASENTIDSYQRDFNDLIIFLKPKKKKLFNASSSDIRAYIKHSNYSASTIARRISSFRQFYSFLLNDEIRKDNPMLYIENPKKAKKIPKFLTKEQVQQLINSQKNKNTNEALRNLCITEILFSSGVRVSELIKIKIKDLVCLDEVRNFILIKGKGNKERIAPLNKSTIEAVNQFLSTRGDDNPYLFASRNSHITRQRIGQILTQIANDANIDKELVSPHILRHSFASNLVNNGADLRVVQELLGHESIGTTQIYSHILSEKLKETINLHPLANNE